MLLLARTKKDVIKLLEQIALYMEIKGENPFKINAYRRAAQVLERDERSLAEIDDFTTIKGIGKGTNAVIMEYITNGISETLEELKRDIPSGLLALLHVPGLGGKRISTLYQNLKISNIQDLQQACIEGTVETLPGFGKKTVENILTSIENVEDRPDRIPVANMMSIATEIEDFLKSIPQVKRFSRAGSLRRMKETVRDLDFVIATDDPSAVKEVLLTLDNIVEVIAQGDTKVSVSIEDIYLVNIDFRIVTEAAFATALHHFTGSKEHNVSMRQLAKTRGEKISEYGIEIKESNELLTFSSEADFFGHFSLNYIPPEVREDGREVEAFKAEVDLITNEDIRGDLHLHTTWSDGAHSIEEMVKHAAELNYEYMAITDHSKFLRIANGLDENRLRRQKQEIMEINNKYPHIHILCGVEMDILPDGSLDFSDEFLKEMDIVIASIHSGFNQSEAEIMNRLYHALENPYVDIIAHPTGRIIGRREPYAVHMEKLIHKAKETNTVLEINANPNRLDLSAEFAKEAAETGVTIAINTDAHSYLTYNHMDFGVSTAKKGWLQKETVLNTWPKSKLIDYLNRNK